MKTCFLSLFFLIFTTIHSFSLTTVQPMSFGKISCRSIKLKTNSKGDCLLTWLEDTKKHEELWGAIKTSSSEWSVAKKFCKAKNIAPTKAFISNSGIFFLFYDADDKVFLSKKLPGQEWNLPEMLPLKGISYIDQPFLGSNDTIVLLEDGSFHYLGDEKNLFKIPPTFDRSVKNIGHTFVLNKNYDSLSPQKTNLFTLEFSKNSQEQFFLSKIPYTVNYSLSTVSSSTSCNKNGDLAFLVHNSQEYGKNDCYVLYTRFDGAWTEPKKLFFHDFVLSIDLCLDDAKNILIVYDPEKKDLSTIYAQFLPYKEAAVEPMLVSNPMQKSSKYKICQDHQGHFIVVWQQKNARIKEIYGSVFSILEKKLSPPALLSSCEKYCFNPKIAFDASGHGKIAWIVQAPNYVKHIEVADLEVGK